MTAADDARHPELAPLRVELREAMAGTGCPLCRLASKAEHAFIESLNYERVLDLKTRDDLKASRGLCQHHGRVWQHVQGAALGLAIVYRISVLDLVRDTEPEGDRRGGLFRRQGRAAAVADRLEPSLRCPACTLGSETAARYGGLLLRDIEDPDERRLLVACGGLCLPHLRQVLRLRGAERGHDLLMGAQREAWSGLMGDLEEFIRKNDYRFGDEVISPEEGTSWTRALDAIAGLDDAVRGE